MGVMIGGELDDLFPAQSEVHQAEIGGGKTEEIF
jgi:hypothetical protein